MKFSTRARYALRIMVELAREADKPELMQLGKIARITGLSENYLAQLAMSLKNAGLIHGISGKNGGYELARSARVISVYDVVTAAIGPISVTACVADPMICQISHTCETRSIWSLITHRIDECLKAYSLAQLAQDGWVSNLRNQFPDVTYLFPDRLGRAPQDFPAGCPHSPTHQEP